MKKQRLIIESIRYITGNQKSVKIQGKTKEVILFKKALNASRKLYENLQRENVSLQEIERLVAEKNKAAKAFVQETGQAWPF